MRQNRGYKKLARTLAQECPACHAAINTNKYLCMNCGGRLGTTAGSVDEPSVKLCPLSEPIDPPGAIHPESPSFNAPAPLSTRYDSLRKRTMTALALGGTAAFCILLGMIIWRFQDASRSGSAVLIPEQASVSVPPDGTVLVGVMAGEEAPGNLAWKIKESNAGEIVSLGATAAGKHLLFSASYHAPKASGEYHVLAESSVPRSMSAEIIVHVGQSGLPDSRRHSARPSFDCGKAKTQVEKMICRDDGLIAEERQMTTAYKTALDALPEPDKQAFRHQHFEWFKKYSQACNTIGASATDNDLRACISRYLIDHTRELQARAH